MKIFNVVKWVNCKKMKLYNIVAVFLTVFALFVKFTIFAIVDCLAEITAPQKQNLEPRLEAIGCVLPSCCLAPHFINIMMTGTFWY